MAFSFFTWASNSNSVFASAHKHAGIAERLGALALVGVLVLDDALDRAMGAAEDAAIAGGIGGLEGEHDEASTAAQRQHLLEALGRDEGRVAEEDDDVAVKAGERSFGGAHGMGGAERGILDHGGVRAELRGHVRTHSRRVGAGDHDSARGSDLGSRRDRPIDHGAPANGVQHLGQLGLHPRALSRRQNDRRPRSAHMCDLLVRILRYLAQERFVGPSPGYLAGIFA